MSSVQLGNLSRKATYYQHDAPAWVRKIWDRPQAFDWFIKDNRAALLEHGAVVRLGRDYFVNVKVFPKTAESLLGMKITTNTSEVSA